MCLFIHLYIKGPVPMSRSLFRLPRKQTCSIMCAMPYYQ